LLDHSGGGIGLDWLGHNTVLKVDKDEGCFMMIKLKRHLLSEGGNIVENPLDYALRPNEKGLRLH